MAKMPKFEKASAALTEMFHRLIPDDARIERRQMFGWPTCFVNGNMFTGLHGERMIFRLGEAERTQFLKLPGAAEFEPMPGRKMTGYVVLPGEAITDERLAREWVRRALAYAGSLPAKQKKPRKKK